MTVGRPLQIGMVVYGDITHDSRVQREANSRLKTTRNSSSEETPADRAKSGVAIELAGIAGNPFAWK